MKKPSKFLAVLLAAMTFVPSVGIVHTNAVGMPEGNSESNTGGTPGNNPGENPLPEDLGDRLARAAQNPNFMRFATELAQQFLIEMRARIFIDGLGLAYIIYRHHHYVDDFFLGHEGTVHITRRMLEESHDRNIRTLDTYVNNLQNTAIPVAVERPRNETQNQLRALVLFLSWYERRRMHGRGDIIISDNDLIEILSVTDFAQQGGYRIDEFDVDSIRVRYMNGRMRVIGYNGDEITFEATIGERYER